MIYFDFDYNAEKMEYQTNLKTLFSQHLKTTQNTGLLRLLLVKFDFVNVIMNLKHHKLICTALYLSFTRPHMIHMILAIFMPWNYFHRAHISLFPGICHMNISWLSTEMQERTFKILMVFPACVIEYLNNPAFTIYWQIVLHIHCLNPLNG